MCYNPQVIRTSINNFGSNMQRFLNKTFASTQMADIFIDDINKNYHTIIVSCGKCYQCRTSRINNWILRATHELKKYNNIACMITLTYKDEYNIDKSLDYNHFQNFMKLLRKKLNRTISYIAVGEYGYKSDRKHFHAFLLNVSAEDKHIIQKVWKFGFTYTKNADVNALRYILKYSFKQQFKSKNYYELKGLTPPMFHCSKGFGKHVALNDDTYIHRGFFKINNYIYSIPRYYFKLLKQKKGLHNTYNFDNLDYKKMINKYLVMFMKKEKTDELLVNFSTKYTNVYELKRILSLVYSEYSEINERKYNNFIIQFKEAV